MVSVNRVILAGNLASDPQLKETSNGKAMTVFPVAVNKQWRSQDGEKHKETAYFRIIVWNGTAETCARYLKKGGAVLVEGRLQTRCYKNREGQTQYITQVVGDQVTFLNRSVKESSRNEEEPAIM
ncbi:MAG: single-stranded DNA-binding protein [Candidatus Riflebacteria bacterium]|nr:single-stranded DNA-binding protein [Candidatus Riflebacteria bacterium]